MADSLFFFIRVVPMLYNFIILWSFEPKDLVLPCYMNPLNPSNITGLVASFLSVLFPCVFLIDEVKLLIHWWSLSSLARWAGWQLSSVISRVLGMADIRKSHSLLTGSGIVWRKKGTRLVLGVGAGEVQNLRGIKKHRN